MCIFRHCHTILRLLILYRKRNKDYGFSRFGGNFFVYQPCPSDCRRLHYRIWFQSADHLPYQRSSCYAVFLHSEIAGLNAVEFQESPAYISSGMNYSNPGKMRPTAPIFSENPKKQTNFQSEFLMPVSESLENTNRLPCPMPFLH